MKTSLFLLLISLSALAEPHQEEAIASRLLDMRSGDAARRRAASDALVRIGDPAVEPLRTLLADPEWELRREAARALAKIGTEAAQPALESAMKDVVWGIREAAARGLLHPAALELAAGDAVWRVRGAVAEAAARHVPVIARRLLADGTREVRLATAAAIAASGNREFRPELKPLLASKDTTGFGLDLFAKIGGPDDLECIRALFDSPEYALAARALRAASDAGIDTLADVDRYVARVERLPESIAPESRQRFTDGIAGIEAIGAPAWGVLAKRLEGATDVVAMEYAVILSRSGTKQAAPAFAKLLERSGADLRYLALNALERLDPAAAAQAAPGLLSDSAPEIRMEAAVLLSRSEEGLAALVESWGKLEPASRRIALAALQDHARLDTRGLMKSLLASSEPWERGAAYEWLIRRRDPEFLQNLETTYAGEKDDETRTRLLAVLSPAARNHLELFMKASVDPSRSVRLLAIRTLGALHDPKLGDALRRALHDVSPTIRSRALQGLQESEGLADIDSFTAALLDVDMEVRQAAVRMLARAPRAATLLPLAFAARDSAPEVRWNSIEALGAFPEEIAAPLLRACIQGEPDELVRASAARAAARFPSSAEFLPALAKAEKSATARAAMVEAAAEAGGRGAAQLLKELASDEDMMVRAAVAMGMGRAPQAADLATLKTLASDAETVVRVSAAAAIAELPGKDATRALWDCSSDSNDAVRGTALAGLVRRGERDAVTRWLDQDPRSADRRADVARALDEGGLPGDALTVLCGKGNLTREGLVTAGICAAELRLWDVARLFFQKAALAGEPHNSGWDWAMLMRALAAGEEGRPDAAGLIRAAVESSGNPAWAAGNAAYMLTESMLLPEVALEMAANATCGPASSPEALDTLGWAQLRAGLAADADATLSKISVPPGALGWLHRACAQAANDRADAAAASLKEALTRLPSLAPGARGNSLLAPLFSRPELESWK